MDNQAKADFSKEVSRFIFENEFSTLGELWKKLDINAQVEIVGYVEYYAGLKSDQTAVEERRKKGALIKGALRKQIGALRKAFNERTTFEKLEYPESGKALVALGEPFWPQTCGTLSAILSAEIIRLNKLLGTVKNVFNEKRFGIFRKHYWLVQAQEFLRGWSSRQQQGEVLTLTPNQLAALIDATLAAAGQEGTEPTEPENIRKALVKFGKNPLNKIFCEQVHGRFSP
jgi:hypothetical protein